MYGFRISIGNKEVDWQIPKATNTFTREKIYGDIHITQWSLQKFEKDKLWLEDDTSFLAVEGVLFNRDKIEDIYPQVNIKEWRGSFACVTVNKTTHKISVYNDQIGSHMLFWTQMADNIYISSDIFDLIRVGGTNTPNTTFLNRIMTYGYGDNHDTMVEGIQRIGAGEVLHIQDNTPQLCSYYTFSNSPTYYREKDILQHVDEVFRQAVGRIIKKNEEYGLKHFYPLSGGLDSRMVQIVARQLTQQPITNFTYAQTEHYDHLLPQQIAAYLRNEWTFLPLDNGDYLADIDPVTRCSQGLVNYNGPSEIYFCSTKYDWSDVGVIATGVNGDNIFSVETDSRHEIQRLYSLSFAGNGLGSPLVLQQYTETYSPFCDVDVLNYVLHVPLRKRWNYHLYDQWILTYYPQATQWLHKGEQIGHRRIVLPIMGRNIPLRELPRRLMWYMLKRCHVRNYYRMEKDVSMNPYDSWIDENPILREKLNTYYNQNIALLNSFPQLKKQAQTIMQEGVAYQRCAVLTVLSIMRQLA